MPPKKKKGKKKGKSEPELSGPEAEAELERKLLRDECKRLKEMRLREESLFNEYQQQKVLCRWKLGFLKLTPCRRN